MCTQPPSCRKTTWRNDSLEPTTRLFQFHSKIPFHPIISTTQSIAPLLADSIIVPIFLITDKFFFFFFLLVKMSYVTLKMIKVRWWFLQVIPCIQNETCKNPKHTPISSLMNSANVLKFSLIKSSSLGMRIILGP